MEPTFQGVIVFLVPILAMVFLLIRKVDIDEQSINHNKYKFYRKTRMDKPVL